MTQPDTFRELHASGIVPASGTVSLDLGAPASGRQWDLRRLAVVDSVPQTARAGTVFISSPHGNSATIDATEIDDLTTTGLPAAFRWSDRTVTLQADDHVLVFVVQAQVGITVVANAQVWDSKS